MNANKYPVRMNSSYSNIRTLLFSVIVVAGIAGCNKADEPLVLKTTTANMTSTKTLQLDISPGTGGCQFTSDNDYIASVSSAGLITAHLVGVAHITVTNAEKGFTAACQVTVQAEHLLYREPFLNFNSLKKSVKDYETRYFYAEDDTSLIYIGENSSLAAVFYFFENSSYTYSTCLVPANNPGQFQDYMAERYFMLGSDNQFTTMMTPDSKTMIGIESGITLDSDPFYAVYYIPFPVSKSMGFSKPDLNLIKQFYLRR